MRLFYRNWHPTHLGHWVNRLMGWWSGLGLPPRFQAAPEVHGRTSGLRRSNPVVIATVEGNRYLVSMLQASIAVELGDKDRAFFWLEKAVDDAINLEYFPTVFFAS